MSNDRELRNIVRERRVARGWSQQELADRAGIARASVSAIEIERLVPSTAAALALAAALECRVEDLFQLPVTPALSGPEWAWPLPGTEKRYWQVELGGRTLLYPYEATQLGTIEHDGVVANIGTSVQSRPSRLKLKPRSEKLPPTLVMACCDPAVGLLAGELARVAGVRLLALFRASRQALGLLKQGLVHVAGLHLSHAGDDGNQTAVREMLGEGYRLVRVAEWEEGVAAANDAGDSIRSVLRSRARWVAREAGSGARECLDQILGSRPAPKRFARDHRGVAEAIRSGWADAGVCVRLTAEEAGLKFLSVQREAYDLCFAGAMAEDTRIRALVRVLESPAFRQLTDDLPGYRAKGSGAVVSV
jgi:molybdate-binding protein/DNA-binding XRE family transcriptional regulator